MPLRLNRRRLLQDLAAGSALGVLPPLARAQRELIPLKDFFRTPQLAQLRLSPDGKRVLGVRPVKERMNLFVFDIETRKTLIITNFSDGDVTSPRWVSAERIVFGVTDRQRGSGDQFNTGLFAIDRDAGQFRPLSERSFLSTDSRLLPVSTFFHGRPDSGGPDDILVSIWSTGGSKVLRSSNLHRLNTRTGRATLLTAGGPGWVHDWILGPGDVPRVALSAADDGRRRLYHRPQDEDKWQLLLDWHFAEPGGFEPLALNGDTELYGLAYVDSDFQGVYRYDLVNRRILPEPVALLKGYDLEPHYDHDMPASAGDPLLIGRDHRLLGVRYEAERRGVYWIDESRNRLQRSLEASFPNRLVSFQGDPDRKDRSMLVTVSADTEAARYYLYQPDTRQLDSLGASRPWLDPARLATTETFRYAARDGLQIPATLTLPRGAERKNLPLIVLHYGGPWVRAIEWDFDPVVQFLASRGYAVFMPAPRGSTGYGWKHYRAGWKQWGLAMQDDVTDGARHLIDKGLADPKRVALVGASYGGYLTMMGLAKEPALFRCGVNWVGVTDPELMYIEWTDFAAGNLRELVLPLLLGDPKTDAEQFARTSPLKRAAEIKQPVLMAYGGLDSRVPIINGERMRDALAKHNPDVEWVVYGDEGHGWSREENNFDFWGRVERFLAKHLA